MKIIDTHAHLYSKQFGQDRDEMVARALTAGVQRLYLPNVDAESIDGMLELEAAYPDNCFAMMGVHPCSIKDNYLEELALAESWLQKRPFCAIGEIGLDYYWSTDHKAQQKDAFKTQIRWAKELNLPIVVHARESLEDILEIVAQEKDERLRGIFHCFIGNPAQAKAALELGFLLGVGGVLTYKNGGVAEVIQEVPLESLVLETDAPYLSPVPFRGKRNESAYIIYVAEKLAEVKGVSLEKVAEVTTANALRFFSASN